jgi:RHS repeat-associated protein
MVDEQGKLFWQADIGVWGELRGVAGDVQACPFRWPGQYEDVETGLYYNRFRYYEPEGGLYVSQDPIGLAGGLRPYSYGRNQFVVATHHDQGAAMQKVRRRRSDRAGRSPMRSPGRPPAWKRSQQQRFWVAIAQGLTSENAAVACGLPGVIGTRWFREGGGMPTMHSAKSTDRYLSFEEREEIALQRALGAGVREIARKLNRAPSTVSREVRRNAATRSGGFDYRASTAQWHAERRAKRPKPAKLASSDRLRRYVQDRLAGRVRSEKGTVVSGPEVHWKSRRHGRRSDRRWATCWSPQQISHRLQIDYPEDDSMRISHEAIYQALYIQGRGALHRELTACLRTGRALRVPRARSVRRRKAFISPEVMISKRPAEVAGRAIPGHWEGDLIIGLESSAIGTLVERTTRFTMLLHLPRMATHGEPRVKNGPALAGHGAAAVRDAIAAAFLTLPDQLCRSLTWDQGAEMAQHVQLRRDTGLQIFFCEPHSPWQRATNENTNGLLRQYFPKGTDLSRYSVNDLAAVANTLNKRPRKMLGWRNPSEVFNEKMLRL